MVWFDTHCHLDCECFDADRMSVLADARAAGVAQQIIPAVRRGDWARITELAHAEPGLHPAFGLHPVYVGEHADGDLAALEQWLADHPAVAIGEIGLDHYVEGLDRARQLALFGAQLDIAVAARLPVVIHARKAYDEVLREVRRRAVTGVIHAFAGSAQQARQFIDLGFRLGFGGALTFERARKLRHLAATLPLEALVVETDAPDIAPSWVAPGRNAPAELPRIGAGLAALRGLDVATVAALTTANAHAAFNLARA